VLKTLGAKRPLLGKMLAAEYGILGLLAGAIGSSFAILLSFAVCRYVLEIDWMFDAGLFVLGVVVTMLVVTAVGVAASYGVLFKKPLSILRGG
jgi:putative ABC transport system permease protein